jgi:hypothetical protein
MKRPLPILREFNQEEFDRALVGFLVAAQTKVNAQWKAMGLTYAPPPTIIISGSGERWIKLVKQGNAPDTSSSVYVFIDRTTGFVHKARTWKAPEPKNPRSSIFDDDFGASGVTHHGAVYL